MSHRPDSSSEANSSCCHRSNAWSLLDYRLVSSAYIAISQITSSGRLLMYSRKSLGLRMEPWETPSLTGYSCEELPSRTHRSYLLLWKEEIKPIIWTFGKKTSMSNPVKRLGYIHCYSSSSPRPVKNPSNSIRYNCKKICNWSRRPKTKLEISKKTTFF